MRHHPLYFALCVLFAIALEFIILRRVRERSRGDEAPNRDTTSRSK